MPVNDTDYPITVATDEDDGAGGTITRVVEPGESYEPAAIEIVDPDEPHPDPMVEGHIGAMAAAAAAAEAQPTNPDGSPIRTPDASPDSTVPAPPAAPAAPEPQE